MGKRKGVGRGSAFHAECVFSGCHLQGASRQDALTATQLELTRTTQRLAHAEEDAATARKSLEERTREARRRDGQE